VVPVVGVEGLAVRCPEDEAGADRRVSQAVDLQVIEHALRDVDHPIAPVGLRRADHAMVDASTDVEAAAVNAVAGVEVVKVGEPIPNRLARR